LKILLDTHAWFWAINEPERLSQKALKVITATKPSQRGLASISIWEFAMMVTKEKVQIGTALDQWLEQAVSNTGIAVFPLSPQIAVESCTLPGKFHKDPADRLITATARVHGLTLVTKDTKILDYKHVNTIW
jgi:PIN domain nuclease of toxin-antitoxin system